MKKFLIVLAALALMLFTPVVMAEAVDPAPALSGIDLTPIFQALIALLASLVTLKLIPWIQARTTAQQQDMLRAAVSVAVYAAEQLYGAAAGREKLLYVKGQLAKKGFRIDIDEIEAAVRDLTIAQGQEYYEYAEQDQEDEDESVGLTD